MPLHQMHLRGEHMLSQAVRLLFSFRGRVSRFIYWAAGLTLLAVFAILFVFIEAALGRGMTLVLYPAFFWNVLALSVKRMHDRGRAPIWLLAAAIPILGPLWLIFELGLRVGTPGENQYGQDPLEGGDYLTVA